jgi:uncharacterized membrane protein
MARILLPRSIVLAACAAGSIAVLTAGGAQASPTAEGTKAPGTAKESPYSSAKDETNDGAGQSEAGTPTDKLGGTKAAGSAKESPYAAAKDENTAALEPTLGKLWGLVLPVALAAGSYAFLRQRERAGEG